LENYTKLTKDIGLFFWREKKEKARNEENEKSRIPNKLYTEKMKDGKESRGETSGNKH
jgi:hypothetical protein